MSSSPRDLALEKAGRCLMATQLFRYFEGKDLYVWWQKPDKPAAAIVVNPLNVETRVFQATPNAGMIPNPKYKLDLDLQRCFGFEVEPWIEHGRVVGIRGGHGQSMSDDDVFFDEVLDVAGGLLAEAVGEESGHVCLMPPQGSPWNPKEEVTRYYSVKKGKWLQSAKPAGLIEVSLDQGKIALGIDYCTIASRADRASGAVLMNGRNRKGSCSAIVTHSLDVFQREDALAIAARIRQCGGLLYPSLAVAETPASNYGPLCLVGFASLVLSDLRPFKKHRGPFYTTTYNTDVGTHCVRNFHGEDAYLLFIELTGADPRFQRASHFYVLGPEVDPYRWAGKEHGAVVQSSAQLAKELFVRKSYWPRHMNDEAIEANRLEPFATYPYLEAKSNEIVSLKHFPLLVCPRQFAGPAEAFMRAAGFTGDAVAVDVPDAMLEASAITGTGNAATWELSWLLRQAIFTWAAAQGSGIEVDL